MFRVMIAFFLAIYLPSCAVKKNTIGRDENPTTQEGPTQPSELAPINDSADAESVSREDLKNPEIDTDTYQMASLDTQNESTLNAIRFGNNTDNMLAINQNPWFVSPPGEELSVTYCIVSNSERFSLSQDKVEASAQNSLNLWLGPLQELNKNDQYHYATDFKLITCQKDNPDADLIFYLGENLEEIEKLRKAMGMQSGGDILARSVLLSNAADSNGKGKGYIWFAPDLGDSKYAGKTQEPQFWSNTKRFELILHHELGHVFGFGHDSVFFMASNFGGEVIKTSQKRVDEILSPGVPAIIFSAHPKKTYTKTFCANVNQYNINSGQVVNARDQLDSLISSRKLKASKPEKICIKLTKEGISTIKVSIYDASRDLIYENKKFFTSSFDAILESDEIKYFKNVGNFDTPMKFYKVFNLFSYYRNFTVYKAFNDFNIVVNNTLQNLNHTIVVLKGDILIKYTGKYGDL